MRFKKRGQHIIKVFLLLCLTVNLCSCSSSRHNNKPDAVKILVFSKTGAFYHTSIPSGIQAIKKLGRENNFIVEETKNAAYFTHDSLEKYSALIFLNTSGDVLNNEQQLAFEHYIQSGHGFVGIHAAADTEHDWPWYNKLVGAVFVDHPAISKAVVKVIDNKFPGTATLPQNWERTDEWYNYKSILPNLKIIALVDESTYHGGTNGKNHPIAWYHNYDGGRAVYMGFGHTDESYSEPLLLEFLKGAITFAAGK